jgi:hypothetical protein
MLGAGEYTSVTEGTAVQETATAIAVSFDSSFKCSVHMNDAFATMEKNEIQLRQLRDIHRHTRRLPFAEHHPRHDFRFLV